MSLLFCTDCQSYDVLNHRKCDKCDACLPIPEINEAVGTDVNPPRKRYFHCEYCDFHVYGPPHFKCSHSNCGDCLSEGQSHCTTCGHVVGVHRMCECGICLREDEHHCRVKGCNFHVSETHSHCEKCGKDDSINKHFPCTHEGCNECLDDNCTHCSDCDKHIDKLFINEKDYGEKHYKCSSCGNCHTGYKFYKCCTLCGYHGHKEHGKCPKEGCSVCLGSEEKHCDDCGEHYDKEYEHMKCHDDGCKKCLIIFGKSGYEKHCLKCGEHAEITLSSLASCGFNTSHECFSKSRCISVQLSQTYYSTKRDMSEIIRRVEEEGNQRSAPSYYS